MLPKNRRIQRKLFPFILKNGRKFNSQHFLLYMSENNETNQSRFSFSISKKVLKLAVNRNLHRRRGYSAISKTINKIKKGYLLFFSFKKGLYPIKYEVLEKEILNLLDSANMIL